MVPISPPSPNHGSPAGAKPIVYTAARVAQILRVYKRSTLRRLQATEATQAVIVNGIAADGATGYNEESAARSPLVFDRGYELMRWFLGA